MKQLPVRLLAVLQLVADGYANADIAQELRIKESTVKKYVQRACEIMGADNRAHAVAMGFRQRLLN